MTRSRQLTGNPAIPRQCARGPEALRPHLTMSLLLRNGA